MHVEHAAAAPGPAVAPVLLDDNRRGSLAQSFAGSVAEKMNAWADLSEDAGEGTDDDYGDPGPNNPGK